MSNHQLTTQDEQYLREMDRAFNPRRPDRERIVRQAEEYAVLHAKHEAAKLTLAEEQRVNTMLLVLVGLLLIVAIVGWCR